MIYLKIYEIVNKFLLPGDKFMPEMHLKQPGFTYSACGSFTKNKERIQKLKKNRRYKLYWQKWTWSGLCSTWYGYGDFKDLAKRTISDKGLRDKAFNIGKNPRYDGYQRELASMV